MGVFLIVTTFSEKGKGLPHMRGGVSGDINLPSTQNGSSPHAWGCFH